MLFLKEFMGAEFFKRPETRAIDALLARSKKGLVINGKTRTAVTSQMLKMRSVARGSFQHVHGLLGMLATIADNPRDCVELGASEIDPVENKAAHQRLRGVLRFINTHSDADEMPSQSDVARQVRLSPAAFSRFFKRSVGKTYVSYLNELRIGRACRELIETDMNVTEIAFRAGFNNLSNFNRRFRRMKDLTPRAYRRLARE